MPPSQEPEHRRKYIESLRLKCVEGLGGRCVTCGYDADIRALQIDHVKGDGSEHRKKFSGGAYYLNVLKNLLSGRFQILCANCNMIKRSENQECPRPGRRIKG